MLYYKKAASPLGEITLRSDGEALTGLWFANDKHYGAKDIAGAALGDLDVFTQAEAWLVVTVLAADQVTEVENLSITVEQGMRFTLPAAVPARMRSGRTEFLPAVWDK